MFYIKYHMNIKYNYHVHKYVTRGSHDLHVSGCTANLYQNSMLSWNQYFIKTLLYCKRTFTDNIVVSVCIRN